MKVSLSLLVLVVALLKGYSQREAIAFHKTAEALTRHYNASKYDSIFLSFSPQMQAALPLERAAQFFSGLKNQAGQLNAMQFLTLEQSHTAVYKGIFDRAIFSIRISMNDAGKIAGLLLKPFVESTTQPLVRNSTKLQLPFKDEWIVFWGGDTKEQNYHVEHPAQKHAFDMIMVDEKGKSFKTTGASNDDYYAFGKELLAPCEAEVVFVIDGIEDNKPGVMNSVEVTGNTVVLKAANNEYLIFAHFKKNSIAVEVGQKVNQGQLLGLCGNSGNSSEPHVHFHIQNMKEMAGSTGVKCYFEKLRVNGKPMSDYSPVKNDKIRIE